MERAGVSRSSFLRASVGVAAARELPRAAWALGFAREAPVCNTVAAEQEVGPYYVAEMIVAVDPTKAPAPTGMHGPGEPPA